jgi:hypothetical protein
MMLQNPHSITRWISERGGAGNLWVAVNVDKTTGHLDFSLASFIRTARPFIEGSVIVP